MAITKANNNNFTEIACHSTAVAIMRDYVLLTVVQGTPLTAVPTVPTLPTISEVKVQEHSSSATSNSDSLDLKNSTTQRSRRNMDDSPKESDRPESEFSKAANIPRNASQPAFTTHVQGLPKNGSVPFFDRIRKTSTGERYKPSLSAIKNSRTTLNSNGDIRKSLHLRLSTGSVMGSRNNNEVDVRNYIVYIFIELTFI